MFLLSVILAFTYVSSQQLAPAQSLTRLPMLWCIRLYLSQYNITTPHRFESLKLQPVFTNRRSPVSRCRAVVQIQRSAALSVRDQQAHLEIPGKAYSRRSSTRGRHKWKIRSRALGCRLLRLNVQHNRKSDAFDDPVHNYATCT